ncbi:hypothetical protein EOE67_06905 [Rheinheimera riviphila]|uniref:Uncharacterized protein n=1 Tax=Rheinheimera riviphila TaxID=1834037 RepID=A0A437R0R5_9GAMM|nr:hypothetical protein [Rheinheimera riviphila]RVU40317.1 hypothetical protein EOE67_06905 [Rheinheimera riviphila]
MTNKWILGSALSTLAGIVAAAVYLVLLQPIHEPRELPNYHAEWLLWFFLAMVLVSMLVNLSVLIAPPASWLKLLPRIASNQHSHKQQLNQYQQQLQLFLQLHQSQLQRLTSQADIYLWGLPPQPVLLQIAVNGTQQAGIEEMRQLFRWMLTHQCRQGFYLSPQPPDLQAEIFAREAGIDIVDLQTLQKLHLAVNG